MGEDEYNYFDKELKDVNWNDVPIVINNDWNYSPRGPLNAAKTDIDAEILHVQNAKTNEKSKLVRGVNRIDVTLYRNATTRSLANELGDIKFFYTKVVGKGQEAIDLWNRTGNDAVSEYRYNKDGTGWYSFEYDCIYMENFNQYVKDNNLKPQDNYDTKD